MHMSRWKTDEELVSPDVDVVAKILFLSRRSFFFSAFVRCVSCTRNEASEAPAARAREEASPSLLAEKTQKSEGCTGYGLGPRDRASTQTAEKGGGRHRHHHCCNEQFLPCQRRVVRGRLSFALCCCYEPPTNRSLLTTFRHHDIPSHLFVLTSLNTAVVLVQCVRAETEKQSGDPIPSLLLYLLSDVGCNREIKEASLSGK